MLEAIGEWHTTGSLELMKAIKASGNVYVETPSGARFHVYKASFIHKVRHGNQVGYTWCIARPIPFRTLVVKVL